MKRERISAEDKLILALDVPDHRYALELVDMFQDYIKIFKVGLELFIAAGPRIVEDINRRGKKVFLDLKLHDLDLKFHDIPNTVTKAALVAARLGLYMFNIHTSGGLEMMKRCRDSVIETCMKENIRRPKMLGVTVLTSLSKEVLKKEIGVHYSLNTHVKNLSGLAFEAGLDGVIASPKEALMIRNQFGMKL